MSASTSKPAMEPFPVIPTFSYAQAAKGRTSNATSDSQQIRTQLDTAGSGTKRAVSSDGGAPEPQEKAPTKRTASEGRVPENTEKIEKPEVHDQESNESNVGTNGGAQQQTTIRAPDHPATTPSSPDYGTTSISSLPKEEDTSSTAVDSSESTWDKHSQSSQNGAKTIEKIDLEDQAAAENSPRWDEEVPVSPGLKEAPPPVRNIWQQRKEAQAAKSKVKQSPVQPLAPGKPLAEQEASHSGPKSTEAHNDLKRQDLRKKSKVAPEDKTQPEMTRPSNKDRKAKAGNDGMSCVFHFRHHLLIREPTDKPNATAMAPPPPPGDAISWPTPDNAITEERKKSQSQPKLDETEKEKEAPSKLKKKAWTQMDFVPSAVFETHVPQSRRGGRGPSGGRDNPPRGRNNVAPFRGADKVGNVSTPSTPNTAADDTKANGASVASLSGTSRLKRASSAGPISSKELRKTAESSNLEKAKEEHRVTQPRKTSVNESRKPAVPIPATPQINAYSGRPSHIENVAATPHSFGPVQDLERKSSVVAGEIQPPAKPSGGGRRNEASNRLNENPKESHGNGSPREREERPGRGRGGRGRGGATHNTHNGPAQNGVSSSNGQGPSYPAPYSAPSRSFSNHERTPSQSQTAYFGPSSHRNIRSNSRSHYNPGYIPNGGRFSHPPNAGPPNLPNIQTDLANVTFYPQGPQGIMSAIPYDPYEQQVSVFDLVQAQVEYYFSVDNLCKDMFLRKHMDSHGFVFLSVISSFRRMTALTTDVEIIRYVCMSSQKIEFKPGQVWQDGRDRLRVREGWENFVLPMEQRDSSTQNDGPALAAPHLHGERNPGFDDRQVVSPRLTNVNDPMDFPYQSLNAIAPPSMQGPPPGSMPNGHPPSTGQVPLSAAVSEFSPAAHAHNGRRFASPDPRPQETQPFRDDEVATLQIFVRQPISSSNPPFHSASSRTFSNGSIDGRNINDELSKFPERQSRQVNGDVFARWVNEKLSLSLLTDNQQ